ncbi:hypothetical protein SynA15127_00871 [Synechococcus sp. A15-127]|uniref:pilus assembly FimT family protein n=1 Tax=Synechococcus sp. A15-127 TaxID=1050624 RepID=UPI001643FF48|nr:type II secretion system protein [Synechococcus sp. A15-127]QNI93959.1 hypothetical protein SynA15127_00871 [Synechococcus sp. A15-127]
MPRLLKNLASIQKQTIHTNDGGFSLLEMIVAATIVGITTTAALPDFQRGIAQGKVDRYTNNIETGFFNLKARVSAYKVGCEINFSIHPDFKVNTFMKPTDFLELQNDDGSRKTTDHLESCRTTTDPSLNSQALRVVNIEGANERSDVLVSATTGVFTFTPAGTTASPHDLTILIQSKDAAASWAVNKRGESRLLTRCVEITGNGQVYSGTWINGTCTEAG